MTAARAQSHDSTRSDAERWRAVSARDASADGEFVFAVRTTGIFCRPSCRSRAPLRRNVEFFSSPAEAARAGYRACKRCLPDDNDSPNDKARALVAKARDILDARDEPITLAQLATVCHTTPFILRRAFVAIAGVSPKAYHDARRASRLRTELRRSPTVSRAIYEAGYGSGSRVYAKSRAPLGITPGAFRRGGAGERVAYTLVESPYGRMLVAATTRGVCAVSLGASDAKLIAELKTELPNAELVAENTSRLAALAKDVVAVVSGRKSPASVPLDVAGTDFQRQVWDALRKLPRGTTTSYAALAESLGRPSAARAVARACATNRIAVIIPCHRVVRGSGELGGYRWGIERKDALLRDERE